MLPTVVLVKPPEQSRFNFGAFSLGVLAAAIRDISRVHILDASSLSLSEAADQILNLSADWIGITTMSLTSLPPVAGLIKMLHQKDTRARIIVGGHGASMLPGHPLEAGAHAVIRGEGELAFRDLLLRGIRQTSPNIVWLEDGRLIENPKTELIEPLDSLKSPARDLMPPPVNQVHLLETSRGCPHDCSFCETTRFYGRRWRPMSATRVARDVKDLVENYGAWIIEVTDDNFGAGRKRVFQICDLVQKQELPAFFMVSARGDDLMADPDILPAMAKTRMLRISVGVETLSPKLAQNIGKKIELSVYRDLFNRMRELGMFSVASFIVGLPGETSKESTESLELAIQAGPDSAQFIPFYPFPGIPMAKYSPEADPDPESVTMAEQLTTSFYSNDEVRQRLEQAAMMDGIRATLARGTLEKRVVPALH